MRTRGVKMTNFNLAQAFIALNKKIDKPILPQPLPNQKAIKLSQTQYEVLCLITMGKSLSEITKILSKLKNISYSRGTIQFIIQNQLHPIFAVGSISELIEKAALMGIINETPPMFLS
jgi:DNA integrity scanning protein DisA with diadenylate cyclase activity